MIPADAVPGTSAPRPRQSRPPKGRSPAKSRIRAIAVLPLENLSRDHDRDVFADGMTDALINDLAQIQALRVISRTTAMRYKGTAKPIAEIARELSVDAIVEGTVLWDAGAVRIAVELVDAATDTHLWARSYEREVSSGTRAPARARPGHRRRDSGHAESRRTRPPPDDACREGRRV